MSEDTMKTKDAVPGGAAGLEDGRLIKEGKYWTVGANVPSAQVQEEKPVCEIVQVCKPVGTGDTAIEPIRVAKVVTARLADRLESKEINQPKIGPVRIWRRGEAEDLLSEAPKIHRSGQ